MKYNKLLPILGCLALSVIGCRPGRACNRTCNCFHRAIRLRRQQGPRQHLAVRRAAKHRRCAQATLPSTVPAGPFPYTIAVDPQGTSAYATSSASKVYQYTINAITGKLTPKSPATVATRSGGTAAIAFTPNGTSAYVVGTSISQYSIDATTGDLTPKSPATVATPPNPEPIAVSPNGKYAYVANCGGCGYAHQKTPSRAAAGPTSAKRTSANRPARHSRNRKWLARPRGHPLDTDLSAQMTASHRPGPSRRTEPARQPGPPWAYWSLS